MTRPTVGLVVLGRRGRTAIHSVVSALLDTAVVVAGALDDTSDDEAASLDRPDGDYPIHVPITPELSINVPRNDIRPYAQRAVDTVAATGADLIAVLCAADIGPLTAEMPLIVPTALLPAFTASVLTGRVIDVVVPHPGQQERAANHWSVSGFAPRVSAVAPYRDDTLGRLRDVATTASERGSQAIVLDCFGFGVSETCAVRAASKLPVISARAVTAHAVASLATPV